MDHAPTHLIGAVFQQYRCITSRAIHDAWRAFCRGETAEHTTVALLHWQGRARLWQSTLFTLSGSCPCFLPFHSDKLHTIAWPYLADLPQLTTHHSDWAHKPTKRGPCESGMQSDYTSDYCHPEANQDDLWQMSQYSDMGVCVIPSAVMMTGASPVKHTPPIAYTTSWTLEGCKPASPPDGRAQPRTGDGGASPSF